MALWFHNEILFWTLERGKDATGLVATFGAPFNPESVDDPTFYACLKQPVDAEDFFLNDGLDKRYAGQKKNANIEFLMEAFPNVQRPLLHIIGHTRAKTTGSELNTMNNHPILIGNIIGVHNGGVRNSKEIFKRHANMTPVGEVDSEAIFQLFAEVANDKPLDAEALHYVWQRIEGPRAVIAFNNKHPHTIAFFRDVERPLEMCVLPELGLMVLCSKREYLKHAANAYQRLRISKALLGEMTLPRLSVDWTTVGTNEGGIVDLSQEFDAGKSIDKFVDMHRMPTMLSDYRAEITTVYKNGGYNGTGFQGSNDNQKPSTVTTSTSTGNGVSTTANEPSDMRTPVNGAAVIYDLSQYDDEETSPLIVVPASSEKADEGGESVVLSDSDIMDDVSEDVVESATDDEIEVRIVEDEDEDEDDDCLYNEDQLRTQAEKLVFSAEFATSKVSVLVRMQGKMKELLGLDALTEEQARRAVEFIYPDLFGDGFVLGYRSGEADSTEHFERQEDALERELKSLEEANQAFKDENELLEKQLKRAATHMANLKGFLFAVLLTRNMIKVDDQNTLQFSDDIMDFLRMSENGFKQVKPDLVKRVFTKKDKQIIKSGLTSEARQLADTLSPTTKTALELG